MWRHNDHCTATTICDSNSSMYIYFFNQEFRSLINRRVVKNNQDNVQAMRSERPYYIMSEDAFELLISVWCFYQLLQGENKHHHENNFQEQPKMRWEQPTNSYSLTTCLNIFLNLHVCKSTLTISTLKMVNTSFKFGHVQGNHVIESCSIREQTAILQIVNIAVKQRAETEWPNSSTKFSAIKIPVENTVI